MTLATLAIRPLARRDIERIIARYTRDGGPALAQRFLRTLNDVWQMLRQWPELGTPRREVGRQRKTLRCWPLFDFPHLVFYFHPPAVLDVTRVMHHRRNLMAPEVMSTGPNRRASRHAA